MSCLVNSIQHKKMQLTILLECCRQAWKFCIFWERRSEPKKIQEPKKTKKKEMKRGERERKEKRGERE